MNPAGLIISGQSGTSDSAYAYRVNRLAESLERNSIKCDYFFIPDNKPLDTETTASLFMLFWIRKLRKYDFLYCGAPMAGQTLYWCRRFLPGLVILDMHGDDIAQSAQDNEVRSGGKKRTASLRVKLEYRMAMSCADYWLTQSAIQMEDLIKAGVPADRIRVIRNGVDLDLFRFLPQPKQPDFTFGYVGAFQVWQGIGELIRAFENLEDSSLRMLLVGFRDYDRSLKQSLANKFGSRLELVDMTDRSSMIDLLESVAILVSARPSHKASRAAFPTKFAEYAALGRPIVVTNVDETADFVRKYGCGFISDPAPDRLAKTLDEAAKVPWETLAEMGNRARHMAEENFSWEKVGNEYASFIRDMISKCNGKKDR